MVMVVRLFWSDRWLHGKSLIDLAPCLVNAVCGRIKKKRTVAQALQNKQWISDITGALIVQVLLEYLQVWDRLQGVQLQENQPDKICWKWTSDKIFSTSSAYLVFFIGQHPIEGARFFVKSVHWPSVNFLFGLCCARLHLVGRSMVSKMMILVCSAISLPKQSTIC